MDDTIEFQEFLNVKIHAGTIVSAYRNTKARKDAYVMEVDFGTELGIKTTSAQVTGKIQCRGAGWQANRGGNQFSAVKG